ncbi:MAG: PPOX class F420-dependent oxidoreductase [Chloroflexota bacterium]
MQCTEEVRRFLGEKRFGVLATINDDGTPQLSPLWYELQGDQIMMNTKRGRLKDRNMLRDPRVSVCIEDEYRWLTLSGTVTLIDDQKIAQADIRHLSERYHNVEKAEEQVRTQFSKEERITIRMRIDRITGEGF